MSPIELDPNISRKLNDGMDAGDAVELPFPVAYVWALNGQTSEKTAGNALYFGGWACKKEALENVVEEIGNVIPSGWTEVTIGARDGSEFDAYITRHIIAAPIAKRMSWVKDGVRLSEYQEGGRRHLQVLAYMAEVEVKKDKRTYLPWGMIVLTAKGYQANNLLDSFSQWEKVTSSVRREVAPGVPAWCFYAAIGTFGKERKAIMVGKPGKQSSITPVSLFVPEEVTPELMESLFVGQEVAGLMADFQDQAQDWLNAWKAEIKGENRGQAQDDENGEQYVDDELDSAPF
jgi:hypothetical protein